MDINYLSPALTEMFSAPPPDEHFANVLRRLSLRMADGADPISLPCSTPASRASVSEGPLSEPLARAA